MSCPCHRHSFSRLQPGYFSVEYLNRPANPARDSTRARPRHHFKTAASFDRAAAMEYILAQGAHDDLIMPVRVPMQWGRRYMHPAGNDSWDPKYRHDMQAVQKSYYWG